MSITREGPAAVTTPALHAAQAYFSRATSCTTVTSMRSSSWVTSSPSGSSLPPQSHVRFSSGRRNVVRMRGRCRGNALRRPRFSPRSDSAGAVLATAPWVRARSSPCAASVAKASTPCSRSTGSSDARRSVRGPYTMRSSTSMLCLSRADSRCSRASASRSAATSA